MKIYLIGMPGSGKSYLGKQLANHLGLPFIDLDEEIEKTEGKTISEVFNEFGEDYFRQSESDLLRLLSITQPHFLMATGGGAPCFNDNITLMNLYGTTIFLDISLDVILERLLKDGVEKRPLLVENPVTKLKSLYENRLPIYSKAQMRVNSPDLSEIEMLLKLQVKR